MVMNKIKSMLRTIDKKKFTMEKRKTPKSELVPWIFVAFTLIVFVVLSPIVLVIETILGNEESYPVIMIIILTTVIILFLPLL